MRDDRTDHPAPADGGTDGAGQPRPQYGALCWRRHRGRVEVLLITSRDTGRWVLPKGWPIPGKTPGQSAAQEAWEEAGVTVAADMGSDPAPLGRYAYAKTRKTQAALDCIVTVYPLRVAALAKHFPERHQRRRRWFGAAAAAAQVAEPELQALLMALAADGAALTDAGAAGQRVAAQVVASP